VERFSRKKKLTYNISTKHPLYDDFIVSWRTMRDAISGEDDIKLAGETYLPMKSGIKAISDVDTRTAAYNSYRLRAEFPEIVSPTIRGSVGLAHDQPASITLPPALEYLRERASTDGLTLDGLHKRITTELLSVGRHGLLPTVRDGGKFRIASYNAEAIINWDENDDKLNYLVLDESGLERDATSNSWVEREKYLELSMEDGRWVSRRWGFSGQVASSEELKPGTDSRGKTLDHIPFVFIDTQDLTAEPDDVPLYGLAKIALRIYRLDADYMQALHMTAEPTPYVTGFENPEKAIEDGLVPTTIGASKIWILPKDATADFLEFSGPGLEAQSKAIAAALERGVMFGAQVLSEQGQAAESGYSRSLRLHGQYATLRGVAMSSAAGLERCLREIAIWSGVNPDEVKVDPWLDWTDHTLDAQQLTALVASWQGGAYSKQSLFYNLQRGDLIPSDRTFEEEEQLISDEAGGLGSTSRSPDTENDDDDIAADDTGTEDDQD
jgi:hypothetical protein